MPPQTAVAGATADRPGAANGAALAIGLAESARPGAAQRAQWPLPASRRLFARTPRINTSPVTSGTALAALASARMRSASFCAAHYIMSFTVAIVGRPNVGKSTLFNRLVGRRLALVDDQPGVTRDRREGDGRLGDLSFKVIDTAGLEDAERESLSARMQAQTAAAIAQADAVLFLVDARAGATPADRAFADLVRKSGKPAILVANKSEGRAGAGGRARSLCARSRRAGRDQRRARRGPGRPLRCAARGAARGDRAASSPRTSRRRPAAKSKPIRIAIVGRPNTGKSTLINRLLGEERLLTGPEAGITRDAIAVDLDWHGRRLRIHDTAGLRRRSRIEEKLEKLSVADTLNAIRFAEVVIVLIDAADAVRRAGHPHRRSGRAGRARHRHRASTNGIWSSRSRARCRGLRRNGRSHAAADQGRSGRRRCRRKAARASIG